MDNAVVFMNPVPSKAPQNSAFKFLKVILPCYKKLSIISSCVDANDDAQVINIKYEKQKNKILRVLNFILFQIKVFFKSMKTLKKGDDAFFWVGDKMFSAMFACKLKKVKTHFFLYGMTSLENDSKKARTTKKAQDYLAQKADVICAESKSVLTDRNIEISDKTKIIHLYVDDLEQSDVKENKVGMLCRLASGKCVLECIEGFCEFHKTHKQYSLDIVGDGILYDECKSLIEKFDAQSFITLKGWLLHEQLFEFMPKWQLLLFATKTEGVPNSVLESMSMGVPVLASYVGGIKDILIDKENGYVLKQDDAKTIAHSLSQVLDNTEFLCDIRKNAKETINQKFTLEKARENFKTQMGY